MGTRRRSGSASRRRDRPPSGESRRGRRSRSRPPPRGRRSLAVRRPRRRRDRRCRCGRSRRRRSSREPRRGRGRRVRPPRCGAARQTRGRRRPASSCRLLRSSPRENGIGAALRKIPLARGNASAASRRRAGFLSKARRRKLIVASRKPCHPLPGWAGSEWGFRLRGVLLRLQRDLTGSRARGLQIKLNDEIERAAIVGSLFEL